MTDRAQRALRVACVAAALAATALLFSGIVLALRVSSLPLMQPGERTVFLLDVGQGAAYVPHLRGQGILFLDGNDVVRNSSLRLDDIRSRARGWRQ